MERQEDTLGELKSVVWSPDETFFMLQFSGCNYMIVFARNTSDLYPYMRAHELMPPFTAFKQLCLKWIRSLVIGNHHRFFNSIDLVYDLSPKISKIGETPYQLLRVIQFGTKLICEYCPNKKQQIVDLLSLKDFRYIQYEVKFDCSKLEVYLK